MTNFEFLRSLNEEEMGAFLCNLRTYGAPVNGRNPCMGCPATLYCHKGHTGTLDWLRAEYEEEE